MQLNNKLSIDKNHFEVNSINITVGQDFTITQNGIVMYGGYGVATMKLTVNGIEVGQCYAGNQTKASLYNSWRVYKDDVVKIEQISGGTSEGNVHLFRPYL